MAAAACSTWISKLDPPVLVASVKVGCTPRYSAKAIDDPAWQMPSTSASVRPASSSASRTMAASSARPVSSSSPVGETASATPTSAAAPRSDRSVAIAGSYRGRRLGEDACSEPHALEEGVRSRRVTGDLDGLERAAAPADEQQRVGRSGQRGVRCRVRGQRRRRRRIGRRRRWPRRRRRWRATMPGGRRPAVASSASSAPRSRPKASPPPPLRPPTKTCIHSSTPSCAEARSSGRGSGPPAAWTASSASMRWIASSWAMRRHQNATVSSPRNVVAGWSGSHASSAASIPSWASR